MKNRVMILIVIFLISPLLLFTNEVTGDPVPYTIETDEEGREWNRLGYDDDCSYHYRRPSATFEPSDSPFDVIVDELNRDVPKDSIWPWVKTGNLDDDKDLELIIMGENQLYAIEKDNSLHWRIPFPIRSKLDLVEDVDGDGICEIFVSTKGTNESQATINVFNNYGTKIKEIVLKMEELKEKWDEKEDNYDFMTQVWAVKDLNHDGRKEIYLSLHTGYDVYPRGFVSIDYERESQNWYYPCASHITNVIFPDLDNDGQKEIVFGTTASKNLGVNPSTNTNDFTSYIIALSFRGVRIWKHTVTPPGQMYYYYTMVASSDVDKDGNMDIICYKGVQEASETTDEGRIFFLDNDGKVFGEEILTEYNWVKPAGLYDLDKDGNLEAVVQTYVMEEGKPDHLMVIDLYTHEVQADIEIPGTEEIRNTFMPAGINDLNGDGEMEIVICTHNNSHMMVFDSGLDLIWEHNIEETPGMAILSDIIPGGVNEIMIINDRVRLFSLEIEVELGKISPPDHELKVMPGDEIEFKVRLENTGNQTWIVEMAMIQEFMGSRRILENRWIKTPDPDSFRIYTFDYKADENMSDVNISIVINSTYISNGIKWFNEIVTWRIFTFDCSILKGLFFLEWECNGKVGCCETMKVYGGIGLIERKDLIWNRNEIVDHLKKRTRTYVRIRFGENNIDQEISPMGGDFELVVTAPDEPGVHSMNIEIEWESVNLSISDSKNINVVSEKDEETKSYLLFMVVSICVGIGGIIGFITKRKKILKWIFPALYMREVKNKITDHPLREKIYRLIENNPGITITDIMKELNVKHRNTIQHHLNMLERRELIKSKRDNKRPKIKLYYLYEDNVNQPTYLSNGEHLILTMINNYPGIRRKDITTQWPYSQAYLTKCINGLIDKDFISYDQFGAGSIYPEEMPLQVATIIDRQTGVDFNRVNPGEVR